MISYHVYWSLYEPGDNYFRVIDSQKYLGYKKKQPIVTWKKIPYKFGAQF